LLAPSAARDRLTAGIYVPAGTDEPLGRIEDALPKVIAAEVHEKKLQAFVEAHPLLTGDLARQLEEAQRAGLLDEREAALVAAAQAARRAVITVDSFPPAKF
jgi:acyl-CoA dehydrogenase